MRTARENNEIEPISKGLRSDFLVKLTGGLGHFWHIWFGKYEYGY
jgi:hypothetical protein